MEILDNVVVKFTTDELGTLEPLYFEKGTLDKYETGGNCEDVDSYIRKLVTKRNAVYGDNYVIRERPLYTRTDNVLKIDSMPDEEPVLLEEYAGISDAYGFKQPVVITLEEVTRDTKAIAGFTIYNSAGSIKLQWFVNANDELPLLTLYKEMK